MIPNPNNVAVGYGYRLLQDNELPIEGDDVMHSKVGGNWRAIQHLNYIMGTTVKDAQLRWNFFAPLYYRRKIEIPAGWTLIPPDVVPQYDNMQMVTFHAVVSTGMYEVVPNTRASIRHRYNGNLETNGVAYIGAMSVVPPSAPIQPITREDRITKLLKESEDAKKLLESNAQQVERLKREIAEVEARTPIFVKADGEDYRGEIAYDSVHFGCAQINIHQLIAAQAFLKSGISSKENSNREFTGVKIGKGLFTLEIIEKLIKAINRKNRSQFKVGDYVRAFCHKRGEKWQNKYKLTEIDDEGFSIETKSLHYSRISHYRRYSFTTHELCAP